MVPVPSAIVPTVMELALSITSKDDLKSWSYNDLAIFFSRHGYESFAEVITENNIDGSTLLLLSQEDLRDMFPHSVGHRAVFRNVIEHFNTEPIENSTTTTCTATATSVLPTVYDDDDDDDHDGNEPKELESTADECFISRDENEPETLVQYAGGTCSKKRREWTRQFSWPKGFSPRTMNFLNGKTDVLTDAIRKEIVNALFSRILDHKIYDPSSGEYNFLCAGLIERWPMLKDEDVNPDEESDVHYHSWKRALRWKFKNCRRQQQEGKTSGSKSTAKRKRTVENLLSAEEYEECLQELKNEMKQRKKNHPKIKELMKKSFNNRRQWITRNENPPALLDVLDMFPLLKKPKHMERELKMLLNREEEGIDIPDTDWIKWMARVEKYVQNDEVSSKKKIRRIVEEEGTDVLRYANCKEEVGYFHTMRKLEALLVCKSTKSLFLTYQDSVTVEMIAETVAISEPVIIRFTKNDDSFYYYAMAEQQLIGSVDTVKEAIVLLIAVYYTFNIKYPGLLSTMLQFMQYSLMNIEEKRLHTTVKKVTSSLLKLKDI